MWCVCVCVWELQAPGLVGWEGQKKERRWCGGPACMSACLPACLETDHHLRCLHTDMDYNITHTYIQACIHAYITLLTCVSRISHGRERERETVSRARMIFSMPSKQTGNTDQHRPGFRAAFSLSMPILHVAVHTILSQSSGLWEHLPKLIGFAGRLGFWGTGGRARPKGRGAGGTRSCCVVGMCSVVQRVVESLLFPASLV